MYVEYVCRLTRFENSIASYLVHYKPAQFDGYIELGTVHVSHNDAFCDKGVETHLCGVLARIIEGELQAVRTLKKRYHGYQMDYKRYLMKRCIERARRCKELMMNTIGKEQ